MQSKYVAGSAAIALFLTAGVSLQAQSQSAVVSEPAPAARDDGSSRSGPADARPDAKNDRQPNSSGLQRRDARYHLQISDVVALEFPLTPEFDQPVTIQPDGFI